MTRQYCANEIKSTSPNDELQTQAERRRRPTKRIHKNPTHHDCDYRDRLGAGIVHEIMTAAPAITFRTRAKKLASNRAYYYRHPKRCMAIHEAWLRKRPDGRIANNLRGYLRKIVKGRNCPLMVRLLGCSAADFRLHLSRQFTDGMTWENHGSVWELDHIRPVANFDLTDPAQQAACFHFTNIRPLLKEFNRAKHRN